MRIAIHANAGPEIGVGHAVRAMALAEEARGRGHEVLVLGDISTPFILDSLEQSGVTLSHLPRGETGRLSDRLTAWRPDLVHLDTYDDTEKDLGAPIVSNVQDGAFGLRQADVVIDPSVGAEGDVIHSRGAIRLLAGVKYAPLRASVASLRGSWRYRPAGRKVLVVMGGTDAAGMTQEVLHKLSAADLGLEVVAVTSGGPAAERLPGFSSLRYEDPTPQLPAIMADCDLVVSAAGTSTVELCCLGIPMVLVCAAENQRRGLDRLVAAGAALSLHPGGADVHDLKSVLTDEALRLSLASSASRLVDGLGSWRTVNAWESLMIGPEPTLQRLGTRRATPADAELLLDWRNDPATRANSRESSVVDLRSHERWLEGALSDPDRLLLIVNGERPVGTVRWDKRQPHSWEVSITVAPEFRGRSLGASVLAAGERALTSTYADASELQAVVRRDNTASLRLFASMGYVEDLPADPQGFLRLAKGISRA